MFSAFPDLPQSLHVMLPLLFSLPFREPATCEPLSFEPLFPFFRFLTFSSSPYRLLSLSVDSHSLFLLPPLVSLRRPSPLLSLLLGNRLRRQRSVHSLHHRHHQSGSSSSLRSRFAPDPLRPLSGSASGQIFFFSSVTSHSSSALHQLSSSLLRSVLFFFDLKKRRAMVGRFRIWARTRRKRWGSKIMARKAGDEVRRKEGGVLRKVE